MLTQIFAKMILALYFTAHASELVTQDAKSLSLSKYVVIGRVTSTSYDEKKFTGTMDIAVIDTLKGKIEQKSLKIPVDKNPISGFDVLLNKGDVAVFFIRELNDAKASLVAPGAIATFLQEYYM